MCVCCQAQPDLDPKRQGWQKMSLWARGTACSASAASCEKCGCARLEDFFVQHLHKSEDKDE